MHKVKFFPFVFIIFLILNSVKLYAHGEIKIENVWISEAPPTVSVLAAYLNIVNTSKVDSKLLSVSSILFENIEIHRSVEKNGLASMEKQEYLKVPADETFILKPGDYHLMLFTPAKPIRAGDKIPLEFNFADGHSVNVEASVIKRHSKGNGHEHHHH